MSRFGSLFGFHLVLYSLFGSLMLTRECLSGKTQTSFTKRSWKSRSGEVILAERSGSFIGDSATIDQYVVVDTLSIDNSVSSTFYFDSRALKCVRRKLNSFHLQWNTLNKPSEIHLNVGVHFSWNQMVLMVYPFCFGKCMYAYLNTNELRPHSF